MAYFIIGASGSGKTACLEKLKAILPNFTIYDFDNIGCPLHSRQKMAPREQWIQRLANDKNSNKSCLLGQMVVGEILACPSAKKLEHINVILLDCSDLVRIERLKKRNTYGVNQDTLNWAAWLRVHCHNPQWEQRIIKNNCWPGMIFDKWDFSKLMGKIG